MHRGLLKSKIYKCLNFYKQLSQKLYVQTIKAGQNFVLKGEKVLKTNLFKNTNLSTVIAALYILLALLLFLVSGATLLSGTLSYSSL